MKKKDLLYSVFVMFVLSIFLPWFTFNAKIMGYCWGYNFLKWMIVPVIIIVIYLFQEHSKMFIVLSELSLVSILTTYVIAFGRWQEICNISSGFQWDEGLHTATAGYWVSLSLYLCFTVILQVQMFGKKCLENRKNI